MNSSVVSEQRRGKGPGDIMAGLCRSIIENVFTKVIRVSNLNRLGDKVVVQGGTFRNDAVLRAFEQYLGKPVTRAPHPGLMGAIGIALLAREECRKGDAGTSFIGLDAVERFEHREFGGVTCRRVQQPLPARGRGIWRRLALRHGQSLPARRRHLMG